MPKQKFTVIAKAIPLIDQVTKERGYQMVEDTRLWETPLKLEFNIEKYAVKIVDSTLKVKSIINEKAEWSSTELYYQKIKSLVIISK